MTNVVDQIKHELQKHADPSKITALNKYFQVFSGGYGEGDIFWGVTVPNQRKIARKYHHLLSIDQIKPLICDPVHECRLTALFICIAKFEQAKTETVREQVVRLYLDHLQYINNWDLVDSSAYKILGVYLFDRERQLLYELAETGELWKQRVAIISTLHFIRNSDFSDTLDLALMLIDHPHDLIHKAIGWMLREIGKRDFEIEYEFLQHNYRKMPRTMLRYAIEKFEPDLRKQFLNG
jgi:3-methyladenine DNA glycosylase AlkD